MPSCVLVDVGQPYRHCNIWIEEPDTVVQSGLSCHTV